MEIQNISVDLIKPYENNPRFNDNSVQYVKKSIEEFGFKVPIVIDTDNNIIAGHTRYKASLELGLTHVPCIIADDLSPEQVAAFRVADNKVSEYSSWDYDLLEAELANITGIDMKELGFIQYETDSFIDDLMNDEEFKSKDESIDTFNITFSFPKEYKADIMDYLAENPKEVIVEAIVKMILEARDGV